MDGLAPNGTGGAETKPVVNATPKRIESSPIDRPVFNLSRFAINGKTEMFVAPLESQFDRTVEQIKLECPSLADVPPDAFQIQLNVNAASIDANLTPSMVIRNYGLTPSLAATLPLVTVHIDRAQAEVDKGNEGEGKGKQLSSVPAADWDEMKNKWDPFGDAASLQVPRVRPVPLLLVPDEEGGNKKGGLKIITQPPTPLSATTWDELVALSPALDP